MFQLSYYKPMDIKRIIPDIINSPQPPAESNLAVTGLRHQVENPGPLVTPPNLHRVPPDPTMNPTILNHSELNRRKRIYYCQRCLNHKQRNKRKNHKMDCEYKDCMCDKCQMVDKRRELNTQLHKLEVEEETIKESTDPKNKNRERIPNCQRCAQHNHVARLKDHKRCCPFKSCECGKCKLVCDRRQLMADQIKLRRKQKKEKEEVERREDKDREQYMSIALQREAMIRGSLYPFLISNPILTPQMFVQHQAMHHQPPPLCTLPLHNLMCAMGGHTSANPCLNCLLNPTVSVPAYSVDFSSLHPPQTECRLPLPTSLPSNNRPPNTTQIGPPLPLVPAENDI